MKTYTHVCDVKDDGFEAWSCNDCGAYAESTDEIEHYPSCKTGESERWIKFYTEEEP